MPATFGLARGLLHFNLHGIHHQNPATPWVHLPALVQAQTQMFHGNYFATAARQLGGPVALQDCPGHENSGLAPGLF
jgi:hypothetical protein